MGFLTRNYWEMTGIHRALLKNEERVYPFVETQFFNKLYMIDFHEPLPEHEQTQELEGLPKRLLVSNWKLLFEVLLNLEKHKNTIDSVTLIRGDNYPEGAMASVISEIYLAYDEEDQMALFLKLKNGEKEVESLLAEELEELEIGECLMKDQKLTDFAKTYFQK